VDKIVRIIPTKNSLLDIPIVIGIVDLLLDIFSPRNTPKERYKDYPDDIREDIMRTVFIMALI